MNNVFEKNHLNRSTKANKDATAQYHIHFTAQYHSHFFTMHMTKILVKIHTQEMFSKRRNHQNEMSSGIDPLKQTQDAAASAIQRAQEDDTPTSILA